MNSQLTKHQVKTSTKYFKEDGHTYEITVKLRYDDEYGNGHNSFAITAEIWKVSSKTHKRIKNDSWGMLHDEIIKHFPDLAGYIKWHLTSSDEPMHYIANSLYWAKEKNIENLESTCVYGAVKDDSMVNLEKMSLYRLEEWLKIRLPHLQEEFKKAMESLGFIY